MILKFLSASLIMFTVIHANAALDCASSDRGESNGTYFTGVLLLDDSCPSGFRINGSGEGLGVVKCALLSQQVIAQTNVEIEGCGYSTSSRSYYITILQATDGRE